MYEMKTLTANYFSCETRDAKPVRLGDGATDAAGGAARRPPVGPLHLQGLHLLPGTEIRPAAHHIRYGCYSGGLAQ